MERNRTYRSLSALKEDAWDALEKPELDNVFEILHKISRANRDIHKSYIGLKQASNILKQQSMERIITPEDHNVETRKITHSLTEFITDLQPKHFDKIRQRKAIVWNSFHTMVVLVTMILCFSLCVFIYLVFIASESSKQSSQTEINDPKMVNQTINNEEASFENILSNNSNKLFNHPIPYSFHYQVKSGDSLWGIGNKFNLNSKELLQLNPGIQNPKNLKPGMIILIEISTNFKIHTVVEGEILDRIANKYGMTRSRLMRLNDIQNPNNIKVGQELHVFSS